MAAETPMNVDSQDSPAPPSLTWVKQNLPAKTEEWTPDDLERLIKNLAISTGSTTKVQGVKGASAGTTAPRSGKHPTQILAEGLPGMPSLEALMKQLKPEQFTASLTTVMQHKGVVIAEPYSIDGTHVPLYEFYQAVTVQGEGYEKLDETKSWEKICTTLSHPTTDSFPQKLAELYHKVLAHYEDVWSAALLKQRNAMAPLADSEFGASAKTDDFKSFGTSSGLSSGLLEPPKVLNKVKETREKLKKEHDSDKGLSEKSDPSVLFKRVQELKELLNEADVVLGEVESGGKGKGKAE